MRLELDIGNTFVKWRLLGLKGAVCDRGKIPTNEEAPNFIKKSYFYSEITVVLVSCVSSSELEASVCQLFNSESSSVKVYKALATKIMCGVEFIYQDVSSLGVDRCLAMVAAYDKFPGGVMVVDCGSAMTADLILATGRHVGGYIFPGFSLLKRSLLSGTSKVITKKEVKPMLGLGDSTEACVDNGVQMMMHSTLHGLIRLAESYNVANVVLTGGDGLLAKSMLEDNVEYDEDLVFRGLGMVNLCASGQ